MRVHSWLVLSGLSFHERDPRTPGFPPGWNSQTTMILGPLTCGRPRQADRDVDLIFFFIADRRKQQFFLSRMVLGGRLDPRSSPVLGELGNIA